MEIVLAVLVGGLYATAIYMLLRRSLVRLLIGLGLLSHAANLLIFTAAGLTRTQPPVIDAKSTALSTPFADPLPQALILTAIVISFGVTAFALALAYRAHHTVGADNLDRLTSTDT